MLGLTERRRAPRVPFSGAVHVSASSGRELICHGVNLSESGMLLSPPRGWGAAAGLPVRVRFRLPAAERAYTCTAVVVRDVGTGGGVLQRVLALLGRRQHGWGLAFRQPGAELRRAVRTFVMTGQARIADYEPA
jgi:hypothetical protein